LEKEFVNCGKSIRKKKLKEGEGANAGTSLTINMKMEDGQIVSGTYSGLSLSFSFYEK
jgi:hypothetical protein